VTTPTDVTTATGCLVAAAVSLQSLCRDVRRNVHEINIAIATIQTFVVRGEFL